MPSNWTTIEIGSLCEGIYDGPHATPKKTSDGPIFLGISSLRNGRIDLSETEHLSEDDFPRWTKRVTPRKDDLVFSYETRIGQAALIPDGLRCCLGRRMALMRIDRKKVDPRFLLYAYLGPAFQATLRSRTVHGSTVPRLPLNTFPSFPITIPSSLAEQTAIAEILGYLDLRIDCLNEQFKSLDSIANAIFKSWFIDFLPVKAPVEVVGRTCLNEATAALFPRTMQETDSGPIPSGWEYVPLGSLLESTVGGDWGTEVRDTTNNERVSIIRGTDIPAVRSGRTHDVPRRFIPSKRLPNRQLRDGDLIVEVSGGSPKQPTGRSLLVVDTLLESFGTPAVPASFCRLFRPLSSEIGFLLAQHMSHIYAEGKMWRYQNQSTGISNFQTKHFLSAEMVCLPNKEVLCAFYTLARPMIDRHQSLMIEQLYELRDTLLPRLISGTLRISEAETQMAAAI